MTTISAPSKRTVILTVSAIVGVTAVSSLVYLGLRERRRTQHQRKLDVLQKSLLSQLSMVEGDLKSLVDSDIRLAEVRSKTLRTHRIYPGDGRVELPSLGLINEQDKEELGHEVIETKEELIRERTQGFEDPANVRKGYKELETLLQSAKKHLHHILDMLQSIDAHEIAELDQETYAATSPTFETSRGSRLAMDVVRQQKRTVLSSAKEAAVTLDRIQDSNKEKLEQVRRFEAKDAAGHTQSSQAKPTKETKKMEHGITFANVVAHNIEPVSSSNTSSDVEGSAAETEASEILEPTEDLEKMKEGISFAEVAKQNIEEPEILEPTEDLQKMKEGVSFAEVASHNIKEPEVLKETEDLKKMKEGISFADVVAEE